MCQSQNFCPPLVFFLAQIYGELFLKYKISDNEEYKSKAGQKTNVCFKIVCLFFCIAAIEYHNLNTSIATRDFWVVTGKDVIAFNKEK